MMMMMNTEVVKDRQVNNTETASKKFLNPSKTDGCMITK